MDNRRTVKKSQLNAKDTFDYERMKEAGEHFLRCQYEEDGEDICFIYDTEGKKPLKEIRRKTKGRSTACSLILQV